MKLALQFVATILLLLQSSDGCEKLNRDYPGCNIVRVVSVSWEECGRLCKKRGDCKYWTWQKYSSDNKIPYCWLKSDSCGGEKLNYNVISGEKDCPNDLRYQPDYGFDYNQCDLVNLYVKIFKTWDLKTSSWEECRKLCSFKRGCKAWTWAHDSSTYMPLNCWLKYSVCNRTPKSNFISGTPEAETSCPSDKTATSTKRTKDELKKRDYRRTLGRAFLNLINALPIIFKNTTSLRTIGIVQSASLMNGVDARNVSLFGTMSLTSISYFQPGPLVERLRRYQVSDLTVKQRIHIIKAMHCLHTAGMRRQCMSCNYAISCPAHENVSNVLSAAAAAVARHFGFSVNDWTFGC